VLPLAAHDSEVQGFLEDGISQCFVTRCRQMNIVFGDKWPQCRKLFGDGALGCERAQCVQDPHVADSVFEERAFEVIANATVLTQHFLPMSPHADVGAVCEIKAAAAEEVAGDGGVENFAVGFQQVFVKMFYGGECLLNVVVLHHFQLTQ
jgi:hypothetical protein